MKATINPARATMCKRHVIFQDRGNDDVESVFLDYEDTIANEVFSGFLACLLPLESMNSSYPIVTSPETTLPLSSLGALYLIMPKVPFQRLVSDISQALCRSVRYQSIDIRIRMATETYLENMVGSVAHIPIHGEVVIFVDCVQLARRCRGERSTMCWGRDYIRSLQIDRDMFTENCA